LIAALRKPIEALRATGRACRSVAESWRLGLLLALILSASLTACGTQQAGSEREPTQTPDEDISRLLYTNFALLRTPPDGIPPTVMQTLRVPVPDMNWSLARRVPVSLPGTYWLSPGSEDLCIVATNPGSPAVGTVCASVNQALRHGIANTSLDPISGKRIIVGVVPNGTRTVLVRSDTSTTSVLVRHGNFMLRDSVSSPPDQLTLR
jgi:hypothetical protein